VALLIGVYALLFAALAGRELPPGFPDLAEVTGFQVRKWHVAVVGAGMWAAVWAGLYGLALPFSKMWRVQLMAVTPILALAGLSVAWRLPA
jgi:hypothetical protein